MKEASVELDSKGILPKDKQDEKEYLKWGEQLLQDAYEFKDESKQKDNYIDLSDEIDYFAKFEMTPNWITGFEEDIEYAGEFKCTKFGDSEIPYILINPEHHLSTKLHEMIHCIRRPLVIDKGFFDKLKYWILTRKTLEKEAEHSVIEKLSILPNESKSERLERRKRIEYYERLSSSQRIEKTLKAFEELDNKFDLKPILMLLKTYEIRDLATKAKDYESLQKWFANRNSLRAKIILEKYF